MNLPPDGSAPELDPLERQVVAVFVDGVRVLGLPRSIGEIYGLLFISRIPCRWTISSAPRHQQGLRQPGPAHAQESRRGPRGGWQWRRANAEPTTNPPSNSNDSSAASSANRSARISRAGKPRSAALPKPPARWRIRITANSSATAWNASTNGCAAAARVLPILQKILGQ